jgi:5'-methylthioadenosine phosphorylase
MAELPTTFSEPVHIGVIGGTGLAQIEGYTPIAVLNPITPWGAPASPIHILSHNGVNVAFLARHGLHHQFAPHEVPNRANIAALRHVGVRCVIAFTAVGSLQEEIKPMDFVVPDQVIDRTKGVRPFTFFEGGVVGHVGFADPFDATLAQVVKACAKSMEGEGVVLHDKGTIICMGKLRDLPQRTCFQDMSTSGDGSAPERFDQETMSHHGCRRSTVLDARRVPYV